MTPPPTTPAQAPADVSPLRRELMELGGPNTLIWPARDPHVVDLTTAHPGGVAMLLSGRDARLSDLVREPGALLRAQRRATSLTEHVERISQEHGVHTCFLAMGAASWHVPGEEERPLASVVLRRAALRRLRPGPDFALDLAPRVEINPVLLTYLRRALRRDIDGEALADLGRTEGGGFNPTPVLEALREQCADLPELNITQRIVVAAFPYGKAEALADLSRIVDSGRLAEGPAAALRAGEALPPPEAPAPSVADSAVLDVTADQQTVLDRVAAGEDLYVDAPPGTGVARLVASVIAQTAGERRSVLLLTEKAAAIEAVVAELRLAGLEDLLVHVTDPAAEVDPAIVAERWPRGLPESDRSFTQPGRRAASAARILDGHTHAMHQPRDPWGVSIADAHDAIVGLSTCRPAPRSRVRLSGRTLATLDAAGRDALVAQVAGVAERKAWRPGRTDQPWEGARLTSAADVDEVLAALERLRGADGTLATLRTTVRDVFADIAEPRAGSPADLGRFLAGIEEIRDTLEVFRPEVFDTPLDHLLAATAAKGTPDLEALGGLERRRLRGQARRLLRPGRPPEDLHAALRLAAEQRRTWSRLTGGGGRPRIPTDMDRAHSAYERVYADLTHVSSVLADTERGADLLDTPWDELAARLDALAKDTTGARAVPGVIDDLDDLRARGLGELVDDLSARRVAPEAVPDEVRFVWWTSVLAEASRDERYSAITGESLDEALRTFVEADRASLGANAARTTTRQRERFHAEGRRFRSAARQVAAAHEGLVSGPPWTRAFAEWGGLLRAAAPAWAMSPFVIGQVLPADERFDLVIVDDASRTSLARTISGIARGDQLLVVGDHGQLPPATWTADAGVSAPKPPSRSLADVAARVLPTASLRDSAYPRPRVADLLVEGVSAGEVVHPPAPSVRETVRLVRVEGLGVIDERTGLVETSTGEVEAVVEQVRRELVERPGRSLGVVTFGQAHAERVAEAVAELAYRDPAVAETIRALPEPLVIKPADRWQREQRDAVVVTVGFGRTPQGRVVQRLGALSGVLGGELVLLAATRARQTATWVSALGPDDLAGERGGLPGHRALRTLLTGLGSPAPQPPADGAELSPLLSGFVQRLRDSGLSVRTGVGVGEHRIDIAIADPRDTQRLLLAVDVDGPGYAGLASTRQRDRILVERLTDLGWHHLRLWAVDIFADPARQEAQVARAVRDAVAREEQS
ncbi:hypothetical protein ACQBJO_02455 [Janibacter sp. G349]|uniref:hypothetical protein n=1 Tax=Janibacter sp. G349 TaxID=3405424 RepID=UPI003B7F73AF